MCGCVCGTRRGNVSPLSPTCMHWLKVEEPYFYSNIAEVSVLHFLSIQALDLRESCTCPALPATDPRVVFSKSVRVLLEQQKVRPEEVNKSHLSHSLAWNTAVLAQTLPPSFPRVGSRGQRVHSIRVQRTSWPLKTDGGEKKFFILVNCIFVSPDVNKVQIIY